MGSSSALSFLDRFELQKRDKVILLLMYESNYFVTESSVGASAGSRR
jgi:hypothetical protein